MSNRFISAARVQILLARHQGREVELYRAAVDEAKRRLAAKQVLDSELRAALNDEVTKGEALLEALDG